MPTSGEVPLIVCTLSYQDTSPGNLEGKLNIQKAGLRRLEPHNAAEGDGWRIVRAPEGVRVLRPV